MIAVFRKEGQTIEAEIGSDAATSQGTPSIVSSHQKLEERHRLLAPSELPEEPIC